MNLSPPRSWTDGTLHRQNIACIQAARDQLTRDQFAEQVPFVLTGGEAYVKVPATSNSTPIIMIGDPLTRQILVQMSGFDPALQLPWLLASFQEPPSPVNPSPEPWYTPARQIGEACQGLFAGDPNYIRIVGHSYGGAVAESLAIQMRSNFGATPVIEVFTYGSPRTWFAGRRSPAARESIVRVFHPADPVQEIFPDMRSIPLLFAPGMTWQPLRLNQWTHSVTGYALSADGTMTPSQGERAGLIPVPLAISAWIVGSNAFGAAAHSLEQYRASILGTPAVDVRQRLRPPPPEGANNVRPPTAVETRRLTRQAVQQSGLLVGDDTTAAATVILNTTVKIAKERYKRKSFSGERAITYAGNVVAYTTTKRKQKSLCKYLNRTARGI